MRRRWLRARGEADQAAAFPVRQSDGHLQVCLIRRRGARDWGIPKGHIEDGDTAAEAALTEAREEAGLVGRIDGKAVGTYTYWKWEGKLTVSVYVMQVAEVLPIWDEMDLRERHWATLAEAERLLQHHPVARLWSAVRASVAGSFTPRDGM